MDRTEQTVRHMLTAIQAPLYDVGVLSSRGMLPGLDAIPASAVLERLRLLKYRNARGSHIDLRPSGEHRYTVLDDLDETKLASLCADGFEPCAVLETSNGNSQAWLNTPQPFPSSLSPSPPRPLPLATEPTLAQPTGGASAGCPASPTASPNTSEPTDCSLSFGSTATPDSSSQKPRPFEEITIAFEDRERKREQRRAERVLSPQRFSRFQPSLERFRTSAKYADRPAAADLAFCVAALSSGMDDAQDRAGAYGRVPLP